MRTLTPSLLASLLLGGVLLAAPAFADCPADGFCEYKSAHFLLDTDVGLARAELLVKDLEETHSLLLQALIGEQIEIPGHLRVLAVSPRVLRELTGSSRVPGLYDHGLFGEPTITLALESYQVDPTLLAHEVAHHLSFFLFPSQETWFAEGLASFVQSVSYRSPGDDNPPHTGSNVRRSSNSSGGGVGIITSDWMDALQQEPPVEARDLFTWTGSESVMNAGRYHAWGQLLYHLLWNRHKRELATYQRLLMDGSAPEAAWNSAFPDWNRSQPEALHRLDEELRRYSRGGRAEFYRVKAKGNSSFTSRPVSVGEVHLYELHARFDWPADPEQHRAARNAELEAVLREDPGNPVAAALLDAKRDDLRKLVEARPGDWRGWFLLSQRSPPAEREALLRRAVSLEPDAAWPRNELAIQLLASGRPREALVFANQALDLNPWDGRIVDTLAEVALSLGQCPQALKLAHRAEFQRGDSEEAKERTRWFEAACSRGPSGFTVESEPSEGFPSH